MRYERVTHQMDLPLRLRYTPTGHNEGETDAR